MSWLFSQALVAAYSAGTCSDGEPCVPLSGNPIPQAYCAPDKMTAFSRLSRFGMTYKPLTDALGEELLTSYLAGFRAKTSALPEKALESPENDQECGVTWRELLAKFDPVSRSWKTAQCSLFEDLMSSSPTLPRWGSMRSGELFRRQTLVPPIAETGSGLLPTPLASNTKACHLRSGGRPARSYLIPTPTASPDAPNHGSNSHGPHNLLEVAQTGWKPGRMWPTPTSTLGTNGRLVTPSKRREGGTLIEALSARTLWPTPTVCGNYNRKGLSATSGDGLATAVATWPTPTASDNRPRGTPHSTARRMRLGKQIGLEAMVKWLTPTVEDAGRAGSADAWRQYEQTGKTTGARLRNQVAGRQWLTPTAHNAKETNAPSESNLHTPTLAAQAGGALNPTWVEWLMGWPLGWTDLKPLEMGKYQQWLQQHGVY